MKQPANKAGEVGLFTRKDAQRIANAVTAHERGRRKQRPYTYPTRSTDGSQFFRLLVMLDPCGSAKAARVELSAAVSEDEENCGAEFVVVDGEEPVFVRDIGSVVRMFQFARGQESEGEPLEPGTVVECDYQQPSEDDEGFWRLLRVVHCDCESSSSSGSSSESESSSERSSSSSSRPSSSSSKPSSSSYQSSSSSYSSSSTASSSSASSASSAASSKDSGSGSGGGSGSEGEEIEVVVDVYCQDGEIMVVKKKIRAIVVE